MYCLKKTERVQLGGRRNLKLGSTVNQQFFFCFKKHLPLCNFSCTFYFYFITACSLRKISRKYVFGINPQNTIFFFNKHFFQREKNVTCEIYFYYVVKSSTPRKLLYWQDFFPFKNWIYCVFWWTGNRLDIFFSFSSRKIKDN